MKYYSRSIAIILLSLLFTALHLSGQADQKEEKRGYNFTEVTSIPATPVKDQHRSSTCWSYASVSFIESELLRAGRGEFDLSEMYFVRKAYELKADKYVRMHGKTNFDNGGLVTDVMYIWKEFGMTPQSAYDGIATGDSLPVHGEMDAVLRGYVDQVIRNPNRKLSPVWKDGFDGILDAYLGKDPVNFTYEGNSYTPRSFADDLGLDPDDYLAIGSFTHHQFYEDFIIEVPDNWLWSEIKNVPLNEMMEVIDHALENGYSVCWDADVGEKGFDWKSGLALIPSEEIDDLSGLERARWERLSEREQQELFYDFSIPRQEKVITQELRQAGFDNYTTTDDHLMHITGTAVDEQGKRYYKVKNSWGTGNHIYRGYLYASEAYIRAKTIFILIHRDAIPSTIAEKLGI